MAVEHFNPDVDGDENIVQIAALTPTDNAVIIGNGSAWTAESGATLRTSLGLGIGVDVQAYDADLAAWAGVNPSSYLTTAAAALAYQPLTANGTSWAGVTRASDFDTFAATPTSANLRALLTDESGSGDLLFAGGALGTPASGVLTNCTGLPNASVVGLGTAAVKNTGVSGNNVALLDGSNIWGQARNYFAANSELFAMGVRYNTAGGSFHFGATNSATPDGIFSNSGGTEIMRLLNAGGATLNSDPIMTRGAAETVSGVKTHSGSGQRITFTGASTAASFLDFVNTTGRLIVGVDSSGGTNYFAGSSAYASVLSSQANTAMVLATNSLPRQTISNAGAMRFHAYGAGTLTTDASGNITAASDESLKYVSGDFRRGLSDLRAMDGPVQYQWKTEQIELAENDEAQSDAQAQLIEAKAALVDADEGARSDLLEKIAKLNAGLEYRAHLASLTREQTTYTGWIAQGVRKGIPEAVKVGRTAADVRAWLDDRPILAAMYNALLDMASRVEALEAAAQ